jgi:diguanylate cyclase (GGDEF)-like protein
VKGLVADNNGVKPKTAVFETPQGRMVQVGYSRLQDDAGLDWLVMVAVPRRDFQEEVEESFRTNIYLGVISAVCVTLLGLYVLSVIARELRKLAVAARRIGEGEFETALDTQRVDELGQLAKSFAEMQSRLLTDQLTGVANREAIVRQIEERIIQHRRRGDARPFVVLFADLNDFKQINDQFGHDIGDQVLREFAKRIKTTVRAQDIVARYAGDEFIVLLDSVEFTSDGEAARQHLEEVLRQPLESLRGLGPETPLAGATIGMAVYPDDGLDVETLIKAADKDMYARKQAGKKGP